MNTTLKHRTVQKDGFAWGIQILEAAKGTEFSKEAMVNREGEPWANVQMRHNGSLRTILLMPAGKLPANVLAEVKKDLGAI